ncbi:sulfite exporter TauE/SafE family protein [Curvivirga aplysinae]|uniref:sulfite exporter TauE/SafE family protein n=1 Tax=Curvivirga aplysinae TaxID=2529852 RepID=UPI0012BC8BEF|nr:sulfite exporter TauE/SafE family protein [Curvivirga aplysinae]MTI08363.1 sulfite exporter TauE/SafE family protein [Curvivirga aplysinae]
MDQIPTDLFFYLCAIPAIFIAGISKGGFGGGLGVVAVPIIAFAVPINVAAALMLPILCCMDVVGLYAFWRKWSWKHLAITVPAAIIGITIGTFTFEYFHEAWIRLIIGLIAVIFSLKFFKKRFGYLLPKHQEKDQKIPGRLYGYFWGGVAGFTSFVAHAGGPPVNAYMLPQKLDKTLYQATTVFFFTAINLVKLIPYGMIGQFDGSVLTTSLVLLPLAPLGMYLGIKLHHKVSDDLFYLLCYSFLCLTGFKLIYDWAAYFFIL